MSDKAARGPRTETGCPDRIGPYRVERRLGSGGMGEVFLARSRGGYRVAVKRVHRHLIEQNPGFRARFRREMEAAKSVDSHYTAAVRDGDADADAPWYAMAYFAAPTLAHVLDAGPMDERSARELCAALAEALQAVHRAGLVHRDLKPSNVLMTDDGPRVIDFGIVRALEGGADGMTLTSSGLTVGTPGYLSPEQIDGGNVGTESDVFALGVLLVVMTSGHLPFGGLTPLRIAQSTLRDEPDLSGVPDGLVDLARRCLERDPHGRPPLSAVLAETTPDEPDPPLRVGTSPVACPDPETPSGPHSKRTALSDTGPVRSSELAGSPGGIRGTETDEEPVDRSPVGRRPRVASGDSDGQPTPGLPEFPPGTFLSGGRQLLTTGAAVLAVVGLVTGAAAVAGGATFWTTVLVGALGLPGALMVVVLTDALDDPELAGPFASAVLGVALAIVGFARTDLTWYVILGGAFAVAVVSAGVSLGIERPLSDRCVLDVEAGAVVPALAVLTGTTWLLWTVFGTGTAVTTAAVAAVAAALVTGTAIFMLLRRRPR